MNKMVGIGVAGMMCVTALAACGGSDNSSSGSYCNDIKSASDQFKGLSTTDLSGDNFTQLNSAVHKIAGEAPGEIKGSWTLLGNQFDALQKAMDDAGLSMDEFNRVTQGDTSGIDPSKLGTLGKALQNLDTTGVSAATEKIQTQVKNDCDIDLKSNP